MKNSCCSIAFFLLFAIFINFAPNTFAQNSIPPYKNPKLPIEQRVDDLVSRMTLEEKVFQMQNSAPAIPRLGIPAYDWWNEALHGVARAGIATVFPQAIGMAATFNDKLIFSVADVISTEARAKHNFAVKNNDFGRYKGLTFWSPNINIFRDPRWGRGQETWGEDPFLTGKLATSFVKGIQGNDPKYLKAVSTVKHFAVHSGPEPERHTFDAIASERDLRETYLPAFRTTILDGKATGVMCAYNRFLGLPACASDKLMVDVLRGEWQFKGHVVSDCGAIDDIYIRHKFLKTEAEASALAVKKGTDLTCGGEYKSLIQAVKDGLISEKEIDIAIKNLMKIRFRLGMFDPPEMVKYAQIPYSENDSEPHHKLSLQASRESLVLLKNDGILPLKKDLKTIAVIGPNANNDDVLLGNYNGQPSVSVNALEGIRQKVSPSTKILYSKGMYQTGSLLEPIENESLSIDGKNGLKAEYFNNRDLSGKPDLVRVDKEINFDWGSLSPAKEIKEDGFSVRWTGKLTAQESGTYQLGWRSNGAIKVFLDNKLVLEESKNPRTRNVSGDFTFEKGRTYDLRVEYIENNNHYASAKLFWNPPHAQEKLREDALNKSKKADVVIMVMGINPMVEGEEMDVKTEGFRGGDRTDIALPKPQEDLIKAVQALAKPVVLVTMGGSALALNWENENLPAILHTWYPGQFGGTAIADVLFGDYNPAGRLPVTFYKSINDLPPFDDYKMEGKTYRYFRGTPLYPFGYGLSYSKFAYSNLKVLKSVNAGQSVTVTAVVQNVSKIAGDEVVQLYLSDKDASVPVPIRNLTGVERINLKPGEKRTVTFTITPRQMSVILENGNRVIEPGEFAVSIGGGQPGFNSKTSGIVEGKFTVTGKVFELKEK
ncbi:MAG: glycoside hydrolase family 3 C-terminal domain-containing protein [Pyrinomonadaceae bacterium]|nr:glycoside hydrolase family 3 C-terminal domain-containing protein [Pyrinomonadaceae bacterium]